MLLKKKKKATAEKAKAGLDGAKKAEKDKAAMPPPALATAAV
jgi:hypothetical protein